MCTEWKSKMYEDALGDSSRVEGEESMLKYLKKYWIFCLLAPLFMVGEVAMDLIQPDMMADIVDNGVEATFGESLYGHAADNLVKE